MPVTTLGAHTFGFVWSCFAKEALVRLGEAGFRHVQLMATPPHYDPWTKDAELTERLRSILDRYGMSLLALDLASSDINLASPSVDVVDFAVDAYARAIDRAPNSERNGSVSDLADVTLCCQRPTIAS